MDKYVLALKILLGISAIQFFPSCTIIGEFPSDTIKFTVVDDGGNPVIGAHVLATGIQESQSKDEGSTDENGSISLTFKASSGIFLKIQKDGYYDSYGQLWSGGMTRPESASKSGKSYYPLPVLRGNYVLFKPPSEFTVAIKKKVSPQSMIHKRVETHLPGYDQPFGYDLSAGDWVAPYGKGQTVDLLFTGYATVRSRTDFSSRLEVSFPEDLNGFIPFDENRVSSHGLISTHIGPTICPQSGYDDKLLLNNEFVMGKTNVTSSSKNLHYIIRTRTEINEDAKVIKAMYGFVQGGFAFDPRSGNEKSAMYLRFTYYLNSDPDPENRSLEYNGVNLLEGYNSQGEPKEPWE